MIKLSRPAKPAKLDATMQQKLTNQYKADNTKAVWKKDWITDPLRRMSYNKCAFSEMKLGEEGKYMQVEHFHPKSKYPDEVVEWDNLFPICNFCNSVKTDIDTVKHPLVDPTKDNPKDYFYIKRGRLHAKGSGKLRTKAQLTIDAYKLNDQQQLTRVRRKIELDIKDRLEEIGRHISIDFDYECKRLKNLLAICNRTNSYSAVR